MNKNSLNIIPLGGLEAIGKNITLIEYQDQILIVDCGIMFPDDTAPGVDLLIPDFSYIEANKEKVIGLVITHGHEDHIGAIPFLLQKLDVPIYASKLTIGLIQSRLLELKPKKAPKFNLVSSRDVVHIGPFKIEFINVNHSILDGMSLAIETDVGTIIHTGDFKIDYAPVDQQVTDLARFADYGEKGVLLLMSDSTNAEVPGYTKSETILSEKLIKLFSSTKGRIIVATFASNIHRIQQILEVAQRYNKKVAVSGTSMVRNFAIATELGYLKYKEDLIIPIEQISSIPEKKAVVICTGSQGEPLSALTRMANGTHKHIFASSSDTLIITASVIPGNEKTVYKIVNTFLKIGSTVYHENEEGIHVSGHASQEELKLMLTLTKPDFFMPIHGEVRHLKAHAKLAESLRIKSSRIVVAENGDILQLTKKNFKKINKLKLQTIYYDSRKFGNLDDAMIGDRFKMSQDGVIFAIFVMAEGMLIATPEFEIRGIADDEKLYTFLQQQVETEMSKLLQKGKANKEIEITIKKYINTIIYRKLRKSPLIIVKFMEV